MYMAKVPLLREVPLNGSRRQNMNVCVAQGPVAKVVFLTDGQMQAIPSTYKRRSIKEAARQEGVGPGRRTPGRFKPTKRAALDT